MEKASEAGCRPARVLNHLGPGEETQRGVKLGLWHGTYLIVSEGVTATTASNMPAPSPAGGTTVRCVSEGLEQTKRSRDKRTQDTSRRAYIALGTPPLYYQRPLIYIKVCVSLT